MPVLLDRGHSRSVVLGAPSGLSASDFTSQHTLDVALINNMPDAAIEATERQFANLIAAASGHTLVRLRVFSLDEVPRSPAALRYIDETYFPIDSLCADPPDGLIVTGAEPRAAALTDEPYWKALTHIIDWAEYATVSTVWSCLAAHAAVLHMDGIKRRLLCEKRSGVFQCTTASDHPLVAGLPHIFQTPHSRHNDLDRRELSSSGYTIFSNSERAGVDCFVKKKRSTFVFFQGHPEYDSDTLFREYRRDVWRFLKGERESYPVMPEGYFASDLREGLTAFRHNALARRGEGMLAHFPKIEGRQRNTWLAAAKRIYRNWLDGILQNRASRPKPVTTIPWRRPVQLAASIGNLTDRD
jgi:homoserine O-succinyltransferase